MTTTTATASTAVTTPKSSTKKKKKRTSKHILESAKKAKAGSGTVEGGGAGARAQAGGNETSTQQKSESSNSNKKSRSRRNHHIKDPEEARSYLTSWKASATDATDSSWKFSKNTQSWLIRHMYEIDKVHKNTFVLLLEYLKGLQGKTTIERMKEDATRRARRYKTFLASPLTAPSSSSSLGQQQEQDEQDGDEKEQEDKNENKSVRNGSSSSTTNDKKAKNKGDDDDNNNNENIDEVDDDQRFAKLDEHDKRKEYKRARKVLDLCNELTSSSSSPTS